MDQLDYSEIVKDPAKVAEVRRQAKERLIAWIASAIAQELAKDRVKEFNPQTD